MCTSYTIRARDLKLTLKRRKPADLAILKSIGQDATETEHEMVKVFSQEDDFVRDFEFTPIHVATLHMYPIGDTERPSLQQ